MKTELTKLAAIYAAHEGVSHWAVSFRLMKKGDFFDRLMRGGDCRTATYQRVTQWFSDHWPADLEWPSAIPRPPVSTPDDKEAA